MADEMLVCPKCGSEKLTWNKKGFDTGKGVLGAIGGGLFAGPVGIVAGSIIAGNADQNEILVTCLACGKEFPAGKAEVKSRSKIGPAVPRADSAQTRTGKRPGDIEW